MVVGNVLRISQSSVSRAVHNVSLALSIISRNYVSFPDDLVKVKRDFQNVGRMPGVIGCIDGTHVRIVRPVNFKKAYVNRKNYHSINVQGICDADCRYLSINATKPGLSGLYDIQSQRDWKKIC
ncbi:putative nuclease HARBI1 [Daphnia magna]|uniref:putative nuclease HARBI1 n=1 Tax=Daphnia magna TaxID=35525 RepID=UPI001E1BC354|nr:putative nuclease HARBI1 [Daphnia magna]